MAGPRAAAGGDALTGLIDLPARIGGLTGPAATRAARLLDVRVATGRTDPPAELEPWLERTFGSVEAVREQSVVKVTNLVTLEATLFAPLRSRRPHDGRGTASLAAEIASTLGDPFCHPETGTPADDFGRIRGDHLVSGANAAMADAHHAVLVFHAHDPLSFDAATVGDVLRAGREWAGRAAREDPSAANYLLIWNCLWRAGGSILHGHAQALLGSGPHYARLERFRRDAAAYRATHGSELVPDMVALHRDLGLALEEGGVTTLAHLTPVKEREVLVVGTVGMDERDPTFQRAVALALIGLRDRLGVTAFNLALWRPPLAGSDLPPAGWEGLPPIIRMVDRGRPETRPSDIGAMELYGTPVVGADPYDVIEALGRSR